MSRTSHVLGRLALVTAGALFGTVLLVPGGSQAAENNTRAASTNARAVLSNEYGKAKSRVEGSFGKHGVVTGTFTPRRFKYNENTEVFKAVGKLDATLTRGSGKVVGQATKKVTLTVNKMGGVVLAPTARDAARAPSCDVLNLVLGPLDLDLLGLQVHLDKVVLNIVAATGAGNLLGNLLCAITGLLDNTGLSTLLTQIQQILNSVLGILRL